MEEYKTDAHKTVTEGNLDCPADHPSIVSLIQQVAKQHGDGDEARKLAMKLSGMPADVVAKHIKANP